MSPPLLLRRDNLRPRHVRRGSAVIIVLVIMSATLYATASVTFSHLRVTETLRGGEERAALLALDFVARSRATTAGHPESPGDYLGVTADELAAAGRLAPGVYVVNDYTAHVTLTNDERCARLVTSPGSPPVVLNCAPILVPDTTAPVVGTPRPAPDTTVSGTTTFVTRAGDNQGVEHVEMMLNGGGWRVATRPGYTGDWQASFDTTDVSNGTMYLHIKVYDHAGTITTRTETYTVSNSPSPP